MKRKFLIILMVVGLLVASSIIGCGGNNKQSDSSIVKPPPSLALSVKRVDSMPKIDGNPNDSQWQSVKGLDNITSKNITINLKGIYTEDEVAFLYTIKDPTLSIVTPDCWYFDGEKFILWRDYCDQNDIEIPYGTYDMFNMAWETSDFDMEGGGCENFCHIDESGGMSHVVPPGAGADLWVLINKHGYGPECTNETGFPLGYLHASQEGDTLDYVTVDEKNPFQVTSGTFNFIGWADERIQTWADNPDYEGKTKYTETNRYCLQCHSESWMKSSPLQGKDGKMPYRRNAVGISNMYMTGPEYIKPEPKDYADAAIITDKDINEGRAVKIANLSEDQVKKAWARYEELNCLVPELILQEPSGNMAQTLVGAQWSDGVWTVEVKRARTTNNPHDIQFDDLTKNYALSTALVLSLEDETDEEGFSDSAGIRVTFEK